LVNIHSLNFVLLIINQTILAKITSIS